MNKFFVVPLVLLAVFLVFERDFERRRQAEKTRQALIDDAKKDVQNLTRKERERAAAEDAQKRVAERERQELERVDKKSRDYETMMASLEQQADKQVTEAQSLSDEVVD